LGSVSNVHITGGANGYVLSTDGDGTLSWILTSASGSNIVIDTFSGTGAQTVFTLSNAPTSEDYTLINIDGVSQLHSAYTVVNSDVTLSSPPVSGAAIEVMSFTLGGAGGGGTSINNGTSNVKIATSGGNVSTSVAGNSNIFVVTGTGANINGTLGITGQSNLGAVGNVVITGGSPNYVLQTDGSGTLSWVTQSGGITAQDLLSPFLLMGA